MSWENILKIKSPSREIMDEVKREAKKFERSQQGLFNAALFLYNAYPIIKKIPAGPFFQMLGLQGMGPTIKNMFNVAANLIFRIHNKREQRALERMGLTEEKIKEMEDWFGDE